MKLKLFVLNFSVYIFANSTVLAANDFPTSPDPELTPGAVCTNADELRYPEKIPYCDRDVNSDEKWVIISKYMKKYNFTINDTNRAQFKIDHYIPLCMGGANSFDNLWPQHESVYVISDPLEVILCQKLAAGKMTQKMAIEKMKQGKLNYKQIPSLIKDLNQLK